MGESQSLSNFCEGGCRTDRTARDDANGPEKRPPVLPRPAHGTGSSPSLISTHKASMIVTTLTGNEEAPGDVQGFLVARRIAADFLSVRPAILVFSGDAEHAREVSRA